MKSRSKIAAVIAIGLLPLEASIATAHEMPWRAGESHQVGYGHWAKGPCMTRTCWAPTKSHRHLDGRIVVDKFGPPECFDRGAAVTASSRRHAERGSSGGSGDELAGLMWRNGKPSVRADGECGFEIAPS